MRHLLNLFFSLITFVSFSQDSSRYFLGRTKGPLPFLDYGIGEDRLGGAKMGFIDSNILVKVVDSFHTYYKVQLSHYHSAYIDKSIVLRDDSVKSKTYLTNNWKVFGDSTYDYVNISLDEKLPFRAVQQINPSRIVVDIFGAESNTNWITQLSTTKEIKNAWYEQVEDDVMRVFIELKHPQHWGYSIYYVNNHLTIQVSRQPEKLELKYMTVAVDAGHGGDNHGADGVKSKILEKDYTLLIAKQLEIALVKRNAKVVMTREKDTTLTMPERIAILKAAHPNFLVSIHLNSGGNDTVSGVSTYYRYIGFRPLTQVILKHMLQLGLNEYGNVGNFNFSLSGPTDYPNCLVEVAFLSNPADEQRILDPNFHKRVAQAIVDGIDEWLKTMPD